MEKKKKLLTGFLFIDGGVFFRFSMTSQVKHPMDMATVVVKLLDGNYKDEGGMVADLRLMVENCRRCVADVAYEEVVLQPFFC